MNNIYLTVTAGSRLRDILRLGTLNYLIEDPQVHVVLLTPADQDPEFVSEFSSERVSIRHLHQFHLSRSHKAIIMARWKLKSRRLVDAWSWLEQRLLPSDLYDDLFRELPPSVVVLTDPIKDRELPLALNAARRGIRTLGLIRSWDNILKRLATRPGVLALPNGVNKQEAMDLELYRDSELKVTGTPQFDPYFDESVIMAREEFIGGLGLDPSKRLILLATAGAKFQYVQATWLDLLLRAQENGEFSVPTQIVCRNHAGDELGPFLNWKYDNREGLYMDFPRRWLGSLGWSMTPQDVEHVANLLCHADVVVTPASTMGLEAAIFDTPAVVVAFNEVLPEVTRDVLIKSTFTRHYKALVDEDLLPVAGTSQELIDLVNKYLLQPSLHAEQRSAIVERWIKPSDGLSSRRIADLILEMAGHRPQRPEAYDVGTRAGVGLSR